MINVKTSITPNKPRSLKFTAHGYMKITSISNNTKIMATKKYLMANGTRAFPSDSIPHSKDSNLIFVLRFGPANATQPLLLLQIREQQ